MEKDVIQDVQASQAAHERKSQERHIEELAGPDDYWLTLTDAARATRRQDVSIRRWISKGLLPVKRQHVGLNQRTRLVRASDLAALTPIIDPAGAISTERGKLDLTSIPTQQAHIKASQEKIVVQLEEMYNYVNKEISHVHEMANEQSEALSVLQQSTAQQFDEFNEITMHISHEFKSSLDEQRHALQQNMQRFQSHVEGMYGELSQQIQMLREQTNMLATTFEETTKQQRLLIDSCLAQIQNERLLCEQLSEHVQELSRRSDEQQTKIEAETSAREQLHDELAQIATHVVTHTNLLELQGAAHVQLEKQIAQVKTQSIQQHSALEQRYEQLAESVAQDRQLSEQSDTRLLAQLGSLTQEVQRHQIIPHDYVKLMGRVLTLEQELQEVKQRIVQGHTDGV